MNNLSKKQIRPSARAVIMHKNELLLLKDLSDHAREPYVFPGGGIEFTESAREAIRREIQEEVGVDLAIGRFLGCFEQAFIHGKLGQLHDISLFFLVEISTEQKEKISSLEERYACCWMAISELHQIDLVPLELKELIPFWLGHNFDASFKSSFS